MKSINKRQTQINSLTPLKLEELPQPIILNIIYINLISQFMSELNAILACKSCNLCFNQQPLLDDLKRAEVFWIGLSAVKVQDIETEVPLSQNTNSGKLISHIEDEHSSLQFYKTNLVKCLPLENDKIRYPKQAEMKSCYKNLQLELKYSKPKIVFLLGKLVSDFILNMEKAMKPSLDDNFNYKTYEINGINYVPVHHPSYILIYKRKLLEKYASKIGKLALKLA